MGAPLCVTSVFSVVFFSHLLSSAISLKSPEIFTFSNNQTLVSRQKVFELGLLKPSESISRWYLGIWFKEDQKRTSVWVANRDNPLTIPVGTLRFFVIGFFSLYCWKKHKGRTEESTRRDIIMNELVGPVEKFQFLEFRVVAEATNHFPDTNILGQGGSGTVYKGRLPDGSEVAIKRLANTSSHGMREFKNEIQTILNVLHLNLVRLLGCCCEGEEIILIYEFLENGSLNQYIFDENRSHLLNWATRHEIIKGIAEGLMYLHSYTNPPIIHRDLKPSNILLGKDMIPKISDFGLAKILRSDNREAENDTAAGTRGYMSEEHAMHMEISERSDIFSFGVTVLEIITGERNLDYCNSHRGDSLLDKAWRYWNEGNGLHLVDSSFVDSSLIEEEVLRSIQVGLLCVQPHVDDRPTTKSVVLDPQTKNSQLFLCKALPRCDRFVFVSPTIQHCELCHFVTLKYLVMYYYPVACS